MGLSTRLSLSPRYTAVLTACLYYASADPCSYGKEKGTLQAPSNIFCWVSWTQKSAEKTWERSQCSSYKWKHTYCGNVLKKKLSPGTCFMLLGCGVWELQWAFLFVWNNISWFSGELISGMANPRLTLALASCTGCTETTGTTSRDTPLVHRATQVMD